MTHQTCEGLHFERCLQPSSLPLYFASRLHFMNLTSAKKGFGSHRITMLKHCKWFTQWLGPQAGWLPTSLSPQENELDTQQSQHRSSRFQPCTPKPAKTSKHAFIFSCYRARVILSCLYNIPTAGTDITTLICRRPSTPGSMSSSPQGHF